MKMRTLLLYAAILAVTLVVAAILWHWQMSGTYFVSGSNGLILDFFPPFARAGTDGDFFIKPQRTIYGIWAVYLAVSLALPAFGTWAFMRLYQRDLKRAWM